MKEMKILREGSSSLACVSKGLQKENKKRSTLFFLFCSPEETVWDQKSYVEHLWGLFSPLAPFFTHSCGLHFSSIDLPALLFSCFIMNFHWHLFWYGYIYIYFFFFCVRLLKMYLTVIWRAEFAVTPLSLLLPLSFITGTWTDIQ